MKKQQHLAVRAFKALLHGLSVVVGAVALTLALFLILPVMQTFAKNTESDLVLHRADTGEVPPPPPPVEDEPEQDEQPEEQPPELEQDTQPLDLSQLELALDAGLGEGWAGGDFAVDLSSITSDGGKAVEELFKLDLDQKPRPIYRAQPVMSAKVRKRAQGSGGAVVIAFVVDERGKVIDPQVISSTDPVFERPAVDALKQWKFEPGKKNGKPVERRIRQTITFPRG